jgi:hypothetical protein
MDDIIYIMDDINYLGLWGYEPTIESGDANGARLRSLVDVAYNSLHNLLGCYGEAKNVTEGFVNFVFVQKISLIWLSYIYI